MLKKEHKERTCQKMPSYASGFPASLILQFRCIGNQYQSAGMSSAMQYSVICGADSSNECDVVLAVTGIFVLFVLKVPLRTL